MRQFIFIFIFSWSLFGHSFPIFETLDLKIDVMPEAEGFRAFDEDSQTIIRGFSVGPVGAKTVVFTGGYGSNALAYRLLTRAFTAFGFRVIVYNTIGFGMDPLHSEAMPGVTLDLNRQIRAGETVVRWAYSQSGNQPVVLAGHSNGGLQARFITLGLRTSANGRDRIDARAQADLRKMIGLVVPVMSPSPVLIDSLTWDQEMQMNAAVFALSRLGPAFLAAHRQTPTAIRRLQALFHSTMLSSFENLLNPVSGQFLGSPDIDWSEFEAVLPYAASDRIPSFLPKAMRGWIKNLSIQSTNGIDLGSAWLTQQQDPKRAIPSVLIVGDQDKIAPYGPLISESRELNSKPLVLRSGHMGFMFSHTQTLQIAQMFSDRLNQSVRRVKLALTCAANF